MRNQEPTHSRRIALDYQKPKRQKIIWSNLAASVVCFGFAAFCVLIGGFLTCGGELLPYQDSLTPPSQRLTPEAFLFGLLVALIPAMLGRYLWRQSFDADQDESSATDENCE
jgi:hypothetical protein